MKTFKGPFLILVILFVAAAFYQRSRNKRPIPAPPPPLAAPTATPPPAAPAAPVAPLTPPAAETYHGTNRGLCRGVIPSSSPLLFPLAAFLKVKKPGQAYLLLPAMHSDCFQSQTTVDFQIVDYDPAVDQPFNGFGSFRFQGAFKKNFTSLKELLASREVSLQDLSFENEKELQDYFQGLGGGPQDQAALWRVTTINQVNLRNLSQKDSFYPGVQQFQNTEAAIEVARGDTQVVNMAASTATRFPLVAWPVPALNSLPILAPSMILRMKQSFPALAVPLDKKIILVGEDPFDKAPFNAAVHLRALGYPQVSVLKRGMRSLQKLSMAVPEKWSFLRPVDFHTLPEFLRSQPLVIDTRAQGEDMTLRWKNSWTAPIQYPRRSRKFSIKLARFAKDPTLRFNSLGNDHIDLDKIIRTARGRKILLIGSHKNDWGPALLALKMKPTQPGEVYWLKDGFERLSFMQKVEGLPPAVSSQLENINEKTSTLTQPTAPGARPDLNALAKSLKEMSDRTFVKTAR